MTAPSAPVMGIGVGSRIGLIRSLMQLVTESEEPESSRKDPVVGQLVVGSVKIVVAVIE